MRTNVLTLCLLCGCGVGAPNVTTGPAAKPDPSYQGNGRNGNSPSGALPNAPVSGAWFSAQFQQLMTNAFPPLS